MAVFRIDPLLDPRWSSFVAEHPRASIFHTPAWLKALQRTYGYEPLVFTTCPSGRELLNGILCCQVNSRLTGRRLVSVPFSDHCEPLLADVNDFKQLLCALQSDWAREKWKYIELRPLTASLDAYPAFVKTKRFAFHAIDLRSELDILFRRFHKSCVQRKIRHAQREHLAYESGRSDALLKQFYRLLLLTRRRHLLPPQPIAWFRNLIDCFGDRLTIRVASKNGQPVAGILTLRHRDVLVYKYGASDRAGQQLGGMQLLFWRTIQEAKAQGIWKFDLGRSDYDNYGLVTFKDRWAGTRSELSYWRYPAATFEDRRLRWALGLAKRVVSYTPSSILTAAGRLYRHIG